MMPHEFTIIIERDPESGWLVGSAISWFQVQGINLVLEGEVFRW